MTSIERIVCTPCWMNAGRRSRFSRMNGARRRSTEKRGSRRTDSTSAWRVRNHTPGPSQPLTGMRITGRTVRSNA